MSNALRLMTPGDGEDGKGEGYDPWTLSGGDKYQVSEFYCRARNKHDHSVKVTVYLKPEVIGMLGHLVADPTLPLYKSQQDVIRDAIIHRARQLTDIAKNPDSKLAKMISDELRKAELVNMVEDIQSKAAEVRMVEEALTVAKKDPSALDKMIEHYEDRLEDLDDPYKEEVADILRRFKR